MTVVIQWARFGFAFELKLTTAAEYNGQVLELLGTENRPESVCKLRILGILRTQLHASVTVTAVTPANERTIGRAHANNTFRFAARFSLPSPEWASIPGSGAFYLWWGELCVDSRQTACDFTAHVLPPSKGPSRAWIEAKGKNNNSSLFLREHSRIDWAPFGMEKSIGNGKHQTSTLGEESTNKTTIIPISLGLLDPATHAK